MSDLFIFPHFILRIHVHDKYVIKFLVKIFDINIVL